MSRIRVLVAEDHAAVRTSVVRLLSKHYDVVGTVADGRALLAATETIQADVLVVDLSLPVISGIEAAGILRKTGRPSKIVFITVHNDPDFVRAARDAGALGYVLKQRMSTDLNEAVEKAYAGEWFTSASERELYDPQDWFR